MFCRYKTLQFHKPSHLHNLLHVQPNTSTRLSATDTLKRPIIHSRLKKQTGQSHIMPRFSGIGFLKNFVNLSFILHTPIHLTPQHLFLLYPHLFFILSSKLTSSANHFLLSLFHSHLDGQFSGSIWLSSVLFISQSFSLYHSQPSHSIALRPNIVIQCLGISLLQTSFVWLVFAGTLNLLTHFVVIISSHCTLYIFIYVIISFLCEEIVSYRSTVWEMGISI